MPVADASDFGWPDRVREFLLLPNRESRLLWSPMQTTFRASRSTLKPSFTAPHVRPEVKSEDSRNCALRGEVGQAGVSLDGLRGEREARNSFASGFAGGDSLCPAAKGRFESQQASQRCKYRQPAFIYEKRHPRRHENYNRQK